MSTLVSKNVQIGADATATNNFTIYQPATPNGTLLIGNGNTGITSSLVALNSSGNLGLGVTPSAWTSYKAIQVGATGAASFASSNSSEATVFANAYLSGGTFRYVNSAAASYYSQSAGGHAWATTPSGTAGNAITFTQAMTLDASGNLLVGTTTVFNANDNGFNFIPGTGSALVTKHASGTASGQLYALYTYNGAFIGSISQNGTTGVLYNTTSDQRLKENIQDAAPASALIDALQVRQYDWKSDGTHQRYGFIAQELLTVAPEAVHQPADPEEMMAVDHSKLVPMLVKEIQSLRQRLAAAGIA